MGGGIGYGGRIARFVALTLPEPAWEVANIGSASEVPSLGSGARYANVTPRPTYAALLAP